MTALCSSARGAHERKVKAAAIASLQLELEARMHAEGDSDAAKNAELMSQRIQDAWVALRRRAFSALR